MTRKILVRLMLAIWLTGFAAELYSLTHYMCRCSNSINPALSTNPGALPCLSSPR